MLKGSIADVEVNVVGCSVDVTEAKVETVGKSSVELKGVRVNTGRNNCLVGNHTEILEVVIWQAVLFHILRTK